MLRPVSVDSSLTPPPEWGIRLGAMRSGVIPERWPRPRFCSGLRTCDWGGSEFQPEGDGGVGWNRAERSKRKESNMTVQEILGTHPRPNALDRDLQRRSLLLVLDEGTDRHAHEPILALPQQLALALGDSHDLERLLADFPRVVVRKP